MPSIVGIVAYAALRYSDASWSGAVGLVAGVAAAPALLAVGAPFGDSSRYSLAILASAVVWLAVGFVAARRATRNPLADWSDFWRHCLWLTFGVGAGACLALGIAAVVLGESVW